jgi:UDP-N-acetylmuramoyl-tripeptide--D-alanyl-D-alanine ligase
MTDALERNITVGGTPIWTVAQLSKALGMDETALEQFGTLPIERVDVDPNTCAPGSLFLHRRIRDEEMESMDQAQGIVEAVKRGASLVITDLPRSGLPADIPAVLVPDRSAALRELARDARARFKGTVIGITGSYGKTTTKDMLVHSLSGFGKSYGTLGNYNELDGVMMTIASIPQDCRFAAIEICSTHLGSLRPKAREVRPDISILTTIGHSHIGNYPSRYDIFRDKFDIFSDMSGPKVALIGREALDLDSAHDNLAKSLTSRIITIGRTGKDDVQLVDVRLEPGKSHATYRVQDRVMEVTIARPGIQFAVAAQFALGVGLAEGCDLDVIANSLASYRPASNQRGARWKVNVGGRGGIVEVMDDSQNSAPESIRSLLEYTKIRKPKKKILVFGDMLELGEHADSLHDSVLPDIKNAGLDLFVGVGEQASRMSVALKNHVPSVAFDDSLQAVKYLFRELKGGELIVLKGSGRINLRQILLRLSMAAHRSRVEEDWFIEQSDAT